MTNFKPKTTNVREYRPRVPWCQPKETFTALKMRETNAQQCGIDM